MIRLQNGIIYPTIDSAIGFTPDAWSDDSYLWKDEDQIMISFVMARSPDSGALRALFSAIESAGLRVSVPCPLGHMEQILRHYGFVPFDGGEVEIWKRPETA